MKGKDNILENWEETGQRVLKKSIYSRFLPHSDYFHVICVILNGKQGIFSKENYPWGSFSKRGKKEEKGKKKKRKGNEKREKGKKKRENWNEKGIYWKIGKSIYSRFLPLSDHFHALSWICTQKAYL